MTMLTLQQAYFTIQESPDWYDGPVAGEMVFHTPGGLVSLAITDGEQLEQLQRGLKGIDVGVHDARGLQFDAWEDPARDFGWLSIEQLDAREEQAFYAQQAADEDARQDAADVAANNRTCSGCGDYNGECFCDPNQPS